MNWELARKRVENLAMISERRTIDTAIRYAELVTLRLNSALRSERSCYRKLWLQSIKDDVRRSYEVLCRVFVELHTEVA